MATRSETASRSAEETLKTTNFTDFTNVRDSVVVVERDTVREVTVVTVDRNERGDTVRVAMVTDREKVRDRDAIAVERTKKETVRDTVYIEKRDSSFVKTTDVTDVTDGGKRESRLTQWLRWVLAIAFLLLASVMLVRARH